MVNISEILDEAKSKNRICPKPIKWQQLYEMLPNKRRKGVDWEPPLPLILAAWHDTPATQKMLRFREHLEWAEVQGSLDQVTSFLSELSEDEWHHIGE